VGLGLLGGSVAKAARGLGLADEIVAVGRDRERLEPALRDGMVDRVTTDLADGVGGADFCLLATPVATLAALLPAVWAALPADAVLTDVGSTKAAIVRAAERLGEARPLAFVGRHPMAGSERAGHRVRAPAPALRGRPSDGRLRAAGLPGLAAGSLPRRDRDPHPHRADRFARGQAG